MAISLVRVDDRIIHGQVVTRWSRERKCDGILAVDDQSAKDKVLSMVLKNAAPVGLKAGVFTVDEAVAKIKAAQEANKNYFIIAKTPETLVRLLDAGVSLNNLNNNKINVGPMSLREGTTTIGPNACVTPAEIKAFNKLYEYGYEIEFQLVPDSSEYTWKSVKDKLGI